MNYKIIFKTAMLAGEIMAQSGAETFRVEDTMVRILKTSDFANVQVYAATTGVMATMSDPEAETLSAVMRISNRTNNLSRITEVNQVSRDLCDGIITIEEAYERLMQIRKHRPYSELLIAIATIISTAGFDGMFGGSAMDCTIAALNGFIIVLVGRLLGKRIVSSFMTDALKSFCLAVFTMFCAQYFSIHSDIVIIGSIMPLVPGIPITNAIRDTLQGDYMSGTARAVEAFVISIGITIGVGFGMGFFKIVERMIY